VTYDSSVGLLRGSPPTSWRRSSLRYVFFLSFFLCFLISPYCCRGHRGRIHLWLHGEHEISIATKQCYEDLYTSDVLGITGWAGQVCCPCPLLGRCNPPCHCWQSVTHSRSGSCPWRVGCTRCPAEGMALYCAQTWQGGCGGSRRA